MNQAAARLFVALPLPERISAALAALRPAARAGVRPVPVSDMHITLHFIGQAMIDPVIEALGRVEAQAFAVDLEAPGHFRLKGGKRIIWIGVRPAPALAGLHRLTGSALGAVDFMPERRPYRPHITVARLAARAPDSLIDTVESQKIPEAARSFDCDQFALYASETAAEGARYRVIETFRLS